MFAQSLSSCSPYRRDFFEELSTPMEIPFKPRTFLQNQHSNSQEISFPSVDVVWICFGISSFLIGSLNLKYEPLYLSFTIKEE